jgi:NCAIR mutase (PurE)-related protein
MCYRNSIVSAISTLVDTDRLRDVLRSLRDGETSLDETLAALRDLPARDLEFAVVDHHRALRCGFPEVILAEGKTAEQVVAIAREIARAGCTVLATRVSPEQAAALRDALPSGVLHERARAFVLRQGEAPPRHGPVAVVTAGTSDLPVADEAALTAELMGNEVVRITDVGVAGLHRLVPHLAELERCRAIVVVAGMEGALASVIGGMVDRPVIAVPTSVGYGVSFGGLAALLGMLSSCASGITVVNIDNGFGAGYAASRITRHAGPAAPPDRHGP